MSYENKNKLAGETEILISDEQNVSRLLSNLKRVDAPKDFDFHLKARIANASPSDYQTVRLFPALKYAFPLALFLLIGGAFILNSSFSGWNVPAVAELPNIPQQTVASDRDIEKPASFNDGTTAASPDEVFIADKRKPREFEFAAEQKKVTVPRTRPAPLDFTGGGSYDSTGNRAPEPISAPVLSGSNSKSARNSEDLGPRSPLQFRQMLTSLGIDASDAGDKTWKVMRLTKNGIAERSGLQIGDVMEAIDDKPINPLYDGTFSVRSITVRRNDKVIKIDLAN